VETSDRHALAALRFVLNSRMADAGQLQVDALTLLIDAGEQALALYRQSVAEVAALSQLTGEGGAARAALMGQQQIERLSAHVQAERQARELITLSIAQWHAQLSTTRKQET